MPSAASMLRMSWASVTEDDEYMATSERLLVSGIVSASLRLSSGASALAIEID